MWIYDLSPCLKIHPSLFIYLFFKNHGEGDKSQIVSFKGEKKYKKKNYTILEPKEENPKIYEIMVHIEFGGNCYRLLVKELYDFDME